MDHSHDDVILPENDVDISIGAGDSKPRKKRLVFIIIAVILFVTLSGSLAYAILNNGTDQPDVPPIDEPNPPIEIFKYDRDSFNAAIDSAEERLLARDYIAVESILSEFAVPERMTASQKYRYYSFLAQLYSKDNLNDPDLAQKSEEIAAESLNEIRKGEE